MYLAKQRSSCRKRTIGMQGFTLLELAVTIIIIAVIAVVALPMYKHAILKSRFSTVMPMAKAVADAQEVYYLDNNQYALGKEDLDIAPVEAGNTQVTLSTAAEEDEYIYVAANRTDIPNVRYIMYQKNSPKFASNIHCEADANDSDALWLCEKALHGTEVTGSLQGKQYKTFLLAGDLGGSSFKVCPENAVCNDEGNVTGCEGGYYQEEQTCKEEKTCDSAQEFIRTSCDEECGEEVKQGTCNVKTGEWEYTVTQTCPVKPSEEENCDNGFNAKMTRTVTCKEDKSGWNEPAWDKSACCDPANKPNNTRSCKDNYNAEMCGLEVQKYTCNSNGEWEALDEWDHSACTSAPNTDTVACDSPFTYGTKTSSYSCVEDEWQENWNTDECGYNCEGDTPTQQLTCPLGCGKYTGTASCNYETGLWGTEYTGDTSGCPAKPDDETNTCYSSGTVRTRSATCNAAGTEWSGWSDWSSVCNNWRCTSSVKGACAYASYYSVSTNYGIKGCTGEGAEVCSYSTFSNSSTGHAYCTANATDACSYSTFTKGTGSTGAVYCSATAAYGCRGSTFKGGAYCEGNVENACRGITLKTGSYCYASGAKGCQGVTIPSGSYCDGKIADGCNGAVIQSGGECRANVKDGCKGATFRSGSCCRGTSKNCPSGVTLCS